MKLRKWSVVSLLLCAILFCAAFPVFAAQIDPTHAASLTVQYQYNGTPIENGSVMIYRVASVDADVRFTLTDAFSDYPVSVDQDSAEHWEQAANALYGYAVRDQISPTLSGMTDASGKAVFTNLIPGLYLVVCPPCVVGDSVYTSSVFLASVPGFSATSGWTYDVVVFPKVKEDDFPGDNPSDIKTMRKVLKVWNDGDHEEDRPESVSVSLFADGELYDTVVLSDENDWRNTWEELQMYRADGLPIQWVIVEAETEDCVVSVEQNGVTFVITNTRTPSDDSSDSTTEEPSDESSKLPQTGQLWWPVPILLCVGMIFLTVGVILCRKSS